MADNTFNFDLDAPAVPTLTLDPAPAQEQAQPKQPEPAAAPEAQVKLSPEEQAMVDQFAEKIDITNSQQVLQYGSACQKKIGDFSEAALSKVSTKDLGEVGNMITDLIGELKSFDAGEEQQKGILGFFKKKGDQLDALKTKYNKAETNVENIQGMLEAHQVQLLKDIAMLDKMYDLNMAYFKELSMYILAVKRSWPRCVQGSCSRPWTRPRPPACRRTPRRPATWPTSASALKRSCTIWSLPATSACRWAPRSACCRTTTP